MTAIIIILAAAFIAAARTIGYSIYTFKQNNKLGGIGLLTITAVNAVIFIMSLYFILTNV